METCVEGDLDGWPNLEACDWPECMIFQLWQIWHSLYGGAGRIAINTGHSRWLNHSKSQNHPIFTELDVQADTLLALSQWMFATTSSDTARRRMRSSRPAQKSFRMGGGAWRRVIVGSLMVDAGKGTTCLYGLSYIFVAGRHRARRRVGGLAPCWRLSTPSSILSRNRYWTYLVDDWYNWLRPRTLRLYTLQGTKGR